ncbi:MAG: Ribonuclease PH, partial [uncultured Nocardioidaceae bacterium]
DPSRWTCRRRAPPDPAHPPLARPRGGVGPRRVRPHPRAVRRLRQHGRPAVAQGVRPRLGDRGVRDAAVLHPHPVRPRVGQGPDRRPDPRDLPARGPFAACGHRPQGARGEHHRPRLRRPPGRRWDPHRRDHRGVRRAGRRLCAPARHRRAAGPAAVGVGRRGLGGDHRRRAAARPALRGGRPRPDRHERRDDRGRPVRRGAGDRRGRAVRPRAARRPADARREGLRRPHRAAAAGAGRGRSRV